MRLIPLLFAAILAASAASAQPPDPSTQQDSSSPKVNLPVSLDKIKEALAQPPSLPLIGLNETPTFKVEIHERQKFKLEDLIKSMDFKAGPVPAGGIYANEVQRQFWHTSDSPLVQPYAPFSEPQLLTVLIENLVGKYLAGRALNAISSAERAHAEAAARDEVRHAVTEYCAAQPYGGKGIEICTTPIP
jgi:hypothetical protein